MNVSGTNFVRVVETPGTQPLEFRINQRITAEIMKVSGDQVTMMVQGNVVVGKISAGDQALLLANRQSAHFIVRGMVDGMLQLQLAPAGATAGEGGPDQYTVLSQNLLKLIGFPQTESNVILGRALLGAGLPVTPELMSKLTQTLDGFGVWGQAEADVSAALLSNGFPLSPGILNLTLQRVPSFIDSIARLQYQLSALLRSKISPELRNMVEKTLQLLMDSTVDMSSSPANLMKQIAKSIGLWGKSIESQLADVLDEDGSLPDELPNAQGLLTMAFLRRELAVAGGGEMVREIDRFLDNVRQMQFLNTAQSNDPTNPPWLMFSVPLTTNTNSANSLQEQLKQQAHLKIAYRQDEEGNSIDPDNNRIVLSFDLGDGEYLETDLSMVQKRIGAMVTIPNDGWKKLVEEELPSLQEGLEQLGYMVQFARCIIKQDTASGLPAMLGFEKINLEA